MCKHNNFKVTGKVGRITKKEGGEVYRYTLDVNVECIDCKTPFEFIGIELAGSSLNKPTTSSDFTQLRIPIRPFTDSINPNLRYEINDDKPKPIIN